MGRQGSKARPLKVELVLLAGKRVSNNELVKIAESAQY